MLKFDLTRKYLVGFLTLAMVLSLFALPVSAAADTQSRTVDTNVVQAPPAATVQSLPSTPRTWTYYGPVRTPWGSAAAPGWQDVRTSQNGTWLDHWFADDVSGGPTLPWYAYWDNASPVNWPTSVIDILGGTFPLGVNGIANLYFVQGGVPYWKSYLSDGVDIYNFTSLWSNDVAITVPVMVLQHYASATGTGTINWTLGPEIHQIPGGVWQMWVTGATGTSTAIYYAQSNDGVLWDILPKNALGVPQPVITGPAEQPSVLVEGGTYYMWFDDGAGNIKFSSSLDGVSWSLPITEIAKVTGTTTRTFQAPSIISDFRNFGYLLYVTESNTTQVSLFYLPQASITNLQPTSPDTNYANVPNTPVTQTITVTVKDQFGVPITTAPGLAYTLGGYTALVGGSPGSPLTLTASGEGVLNLTLTPTAGTFTGHSSLTTTVVFSRPDTTGSPITFTKVWTYTPTFAGASGVAVDTAGTTQYNEIGDTHTVAVSFTDQYGNPLSVAYDLNLNKVNAPTATLDHAAGTGTGTVFSYIGTTAGTDILTITGTVAGQAVGVNPVIPAGTKVWAYPWDVLPHDAVNVMGAPHTIVIYGAAGDLYSVLWSTQFGSNQQPILVSGSAGWTGTLGDTGTATLIVKAEWPGKYFFDVTITGTRDVAGAAPTLTSTTIKVAKSWAQLTGFDITPTLDINPITQVPTWDVHTVTVVVLGEYPVKTSLTIPNVPPPLGGTYILDHGVLWVIDAPLAGVPVSWDVNWNYMKNGQVDIYADRVGDAAYLPGVKDLHPGLRAVNEHQDGIALNSVQHDLYATSISDANGEASLTYHLELDASATWSPTITSRTCTYYWPCFVDKITATAHYPEQALTDEFGYITGTSTKEWRDHAFKLVKYNGYLPLGDPQGYIPGAKFFLRRLDLVGTPTYVPPMPLGKGWSPTYAPLTNEPGNGYIVVMTTDTVPLPADPPGVLTTDVYGEALWMHLPYGTYGLFEYSVPAPFTVNTGTLFTFIINADAPYWCRATGDKITTHYEPNGITPTGPSFYKLTWCGTKMTGVHFEVTNLDTPQTILYTTGVNGLLQIKLTDFHPSFDPVDGTWYQVHEISDVVLDTWGVTAVPDFYFFISATGAWDGHYYNATTAIVANRVWELTVLPWAFDLTARHWVVDPKRQSYDLNDLTITASPDELQLPDETISELTVTALNQYDEPMEGVLVDLTTDFGFLSVPYVVTGPDGTATLEIFSDEAGPALVEATSGALSDTVVITWLASESENTLSLLKGWNLVGVGIKTDMTVADLFGNNFLRAYAWDPSLPGPSGGSGSYFSYGNEIPEPGVGFWVKMAAGGNVTMNGEVVVSPVSLVLYEGWNIVANPFDAAIDWSTVTLGGEPIADTTAMAFSFDGTTYHMVDFATDSLAVGQGFWLSLDADAAIVFTK